MKNYVLEVNNSLKSNFFEHAYSPFMILNVNMDFVDVNNAAVDVLGINKQNFIGKNLLDICPYLKKTDRFNSYKKVIETGISIGFDNLLFKKDNIEYTFFVKAFKVGDYLGIATLDVTSSTGTIAALKSTQASLKDVNFNLEKKNQELEDYSYATAHDLRAPLTNMKSLLNMVLKSNPTSSEFATIIEKMQIVTKLMCDKIRALNQVIAVKSTFSELKDELVFSDILDLIKLSHSEEIIESRAIIKEDFLSCSKIVYNRFQLESVLENLMSNALKYKHPSRILSIKIATKEINGKIHLTFKDNGIGFNQKLVGKIFGLFKRLHTHVDGLGIGLYIMNSIINENGGKIDVTSEVDKGTEFRIQF